MPLTKLQIAPGIDKQNTEYGAEGRWVDSDNVRFRYGLPEKIGGWAKVSSDALLGATRAVPSTSIRIYPVKSPMLVSVVILPDVSDWLSPSNLMKG